jgi:hypothetical protein
MTKIAESGSESGFISQRHGCADPDPYQNVMDPQHCYLLKKSSRKGKGAKLFENLGKVLNRTAAGASRVPITVTARIADLNPAR